VSHKLQTTRTPVHTQATNCLPNSGIGNRKN
jgi:hypothetical protein